MASAPAPTSPWVILGSIPRVADLEGGADVSLALAAPPRVSRLAISPRVFPDRPTPRNFPFVLAADPSGLLLLSAILDAPLTRVHVDRPGEQSVRLRYSDPRYFVLDAATGSALRLPDPDPKLPIQHQAFVGVLASPRGGGYVVAELLPFMGTEKADLRCFASDVGEWVTKRVRYPLPARVYAPIRTLAHHGRLWWVDYSWGVLTADPFADDPVLVFVPLPRPCVLKSREAWGVLDQFRYVGVSAGRLRFVDTYRRGGAPDKVTVWTLRDPDATEWTLEHQATFADVWADDTYKATGLPMTAPVLALIHPHNPAVVYFFHKDHLFAVDVPARKVVDCERYHLVAPPREYGIANRFVRDWELPRAVSSDTPTAILHAPQPASPPTGVTVPRSRRTRRATVSTRSSMRLAARPSSVPVAERAQRKLMRELSFIDNQQQAPDAAVAEYLDMYAEDLPEKAIKAIQAATRLGNKNLVKILEAIVQEADALEMEA